MNNSKFNKIKNLKFDFKDYIKNIYKIIYLYIYIYIYIYYKM